MTPVCQHEVEISGTQTNEHARLYQLNVTSFL